MNVQKISSRYKVLEKGIVYYSIVSAVLRLGLAGREIEFMAYVRHIGGISNIEQKRKYVELVNSSLATVNNMISKFLKRGLLVKENGIIMTNSKMSPDLGNKIVLQITLDTENMDNEKS